MAELETLLVKLEAETAGLRRDLARAGQSVDRFGNNAQRGLNTFQRGMRDAQRQALRFASGVAASLAGLFTAQAINGVVNYSAQLENLSRRLGFTSEQIQVMRFAASDFGIEANQVDLALQRFTRRVGQAATTGDGELLPVLQRLGIAFRDEATGGPRDAMEVLLEYADAVQSMGSQSDRLVAAFKAFDSEGAALVTVLQQGREGILNYGSAAHELGVIISNETTARARELRRELDIIGQRMRMEFTQTVLDNASAMEDLATAAGDAVTALGQVVQILQWSGNTLGSWWVDMFALDDVVGARDPVAEAEAVRDVLGDLYAEATTTASAFDRLAASIGEVRARELFEQAGVNVPARSRATSGVLGMSSTDLIRPSTDEALRLAEALEAAAGELDRLGRLYATLPDPQQGDAVQYFLDLVDAIADVNEESGRRVFTTETEAEANERLAASFRALNEAMAARAARATELAAGSITPLMALRAALDEIRALTASGDLQAAAITIGVDIDRVRLNAVLAAYRDFIADGGEAAEAAAALQEALDGLQVSDSVIAAISDMPQKLKESVEAARTLGTEIGDSIAGSIGDAILKAESLRDVLQSVAQDIARILVQRFVTNPLADFLGNMFTGGLGAGSGAGTSIGTDGGTIISTGIKASGAQMRTAMAGAAVGQSITVSMPVTINAAGADPEGLRRLREQVQQLQDEAPGQFASIMRERQRRSGSVGV